MKWRQENLSRMEVVKGREQTKIEEAAKRLEAKDRAGIPKNERIRRISKHFI